MFINKQCVSNILNIAMQTIRYFYNGCYFWILIGRKVSNQFFNHLAGVPAVNQITGLY